MSSHAWAAICAVTVAALFVLDLLTGERTVVALYVAGPLLAALRAGPRATAGVGVVALTLALAQLSAHGSGDAGQDAVRVLTVALLSVLAVWHARLRERQAVGERTRRELLGRLEEAFGLLDAIFARAPVGLASFDRALRFARVNDRMAEMTGHAPDEHAGHTIADLIPELPREVTADLERVLATGRPLTEVHVSGVTPARPGVRREWLASYWPVREVADGAISGVGCVLFEVTERQQAQRELRAQTDRYEALLLALSEAGEGMLVLEADGRIIYANAAFEHLSGYALPELTAMESVVDLVVPEARGDARERVKLRIELGIVDPDYEVAMRRRDGELVQLEVVGVPLRVENRNQVFVVVHDVTERRRVEAERERLLHRSTLLAEASELFDQTPDEAGTLERVARLCVRELADTCVVLLGESPHAIRRVAAAARERHVERALLELQLRYPPDEAPSLPVAETLRTGRTQVIEPIGEPEIAARAVDARHGELLRELGTSSAIIVPLRARGSVRGVLALGFGTLNGRAGEDLVALFEDLGQRAALALDTARLHEERAAVVRVLQRSLLPPALPEVPGLEIAARHRAAGEGSDVGGDFYDCFPAGDGEWVALIGDVCGRGAEAAAITALARHTIRSAVVHDPEPAAVLRALNAAILRHGSDYRYCTVLYVRLVPSAAGVDAHIATGGHPLPALLRASGEVEVPGRPGTLLGVVAEPEIGECAVRLCAGDTLVLFTDGALDAGPEEGAAGPERLAAFLGTCAGNDAGRIAARVERRVVERQSGSLRDDVAVLVLRSSPEPGGAPFVAAGKGVAAPS